jgi:hypothetical protein
MASDSARFPAAIIKIIAAKLMEEDERPVNGTRQAFAAARFRLQHDPEK